MFDSMKPWRMSPSTLLCAKRGFSLVVLFAMTVQLIGCGSPFVGRWKSDSFQPPNPEIKGPGSLVVNIRDDQTFTATYESKDKSAKRAGSGRWDEESKNTIRLFVKAGDGPELTNAELADNNTLQLIGKGVAEKLKRD